MESATEIRYISAYLCCRQRFINSLMKTVLRDFIFNCAVGVLSSLMSKVHFTLSLYSELFLSVY